MGDDAALPVIDGIDSAAGVENSGTRELFLSLLGDFYKLIDRKSSLINSYLNDRMLRDYTIEVHALKNTSRMIGALELSELFKKLEQMGNAEDLEGLLRGTPEALERMQRLKPALAPYAAASEGEKEQVADEVIKDTLRRLHDAMEGFDLDGADEAMKQLGGYAVPEQYQERIEELDALVADVAMEEVLARTEELIRLF